MDGLHGRRLVFWWIHVEDGGDHDSEGIERVVQTKSTDKLGSDTGRGELMTSRAEEGEDPNATPDAQHHDSISTLHGMGRTNNE